MNLFALPPLESRFVYRPLHSLITTPAATSGRFTKCILRN